MVEFSYLRAQMKAEMPRAVLSPEAELARAILTPAVFVAMADGDIQQAEQREFTRIFARDVDCGRAIVSGVDITDLFLDLRGDVRTGDPEDLVEEAYERLNDERVLRAIGYALRVANADGNFDVEEQGTLLALAKNFGVSSAQVAELLAAQTDGEAV